MTDAFAQYGQQVGKRETKRKRNQVMALSPLEQRARERERLSRAYRAWRRAGTKAVLQSEPRLVGFLKYLRTVTAETGTELIEAVEVCDWLRTAPQATRIFALRMIAARCDRINQQLGNDVLDDPIPPETSTYFEARALLHPGGRA